MMADKSPLTANKLAKEAKLSPESLNFPFRKDHAHILAGFCDPWEDIGYHLRLNYAKINAIKEDNGTAEKRRIATLQAWKEKFAHRATYRVLIEALISCGRAQQALDLCIKVKDQVQPASESDNSSVIPKSPSLLMIEPISPVEHDSSSEELRHFRVSKEPPSKPIRAKGTTNDCDASMIKLRDAIIRSNSKPLAAGIHLDSPGESERDTAMRTYNVLEIKSKFSSLLLDVRLALEQGQIEVKDVHQFLVGLFQCDGIPRSDHMEILEAVSTANLWDYQNYSPVGNLIMRFLPNKAGLMTAYRKHFSGFCLTTKLIDYVREEKLFTAIGDPANSPNLLPLHNYTLEHYQKLRVVLGIERSISEISLQYVQDIWMVFADEFDLPFLTAIIDQILEGSLTIVWRIPPYIGNMIAQSAHKCSAFFIQHHIILISLGDSVLYDARLHIGLQDDGEHNTSAKNQTSKMSVSDAMDEPTCPSYLALRAPGVIKPKASSIHPLDYEPPARFHHCGAVASDGKFYSYGGRFGHVKPGSSSYKKKDVLRRRETSFSVVRTTINRFDAATERWHCLPTSGNPPPGRIGAACAVVGSKFYVFGGRSRNRLFSTLSELDLDTMIWKELEPLSPPDNTPMAKMGAAMVSIDNRYLIVYGGYGAPAAAHSQVQGVEYVPDPGKGAWTNELHCFDLKTGKWCRQLTVGESPAPCSGCTFTLVGKRKAVLFGGSQLSNNCVPNNVHILDLKSWKWEQVCHDNDRPWPEARVGHSAVSLHDPDSSPEEPELLILWGQDDETPVSTLKDGWVLKICKNGTLEWTEILLPDDIQERLYHTTALFHLSPSQKRIVNFGGVEENDKPPIAKSLVMDIGTTGETPRGRWTVSKARNPDPKTLVHLKSDPEYPGVKFFAESLRETIPSKNQPTVLDRRDIGMKLSIPEGAIQDEANDAVQLDVQPCFNGPFKVPPGCQLTSPVYMIRKQCKFKKHVKMEIEHFANLESGEDSEEMFFVAANSSPRYHGAHPVYNLQEIEKSEHSSTFTPGEQVGVITFQELKPGPLGTARKSTNGSESGWKYSVRLYKSPPSLLFSLAIFTICRLHSVYLKHLESLIKENYPSVRMQTSSQPVDFTGSAAEITTDSIEGWTIVPSRKPTVISKDEVDLPEHVEISPGELDYPPWIDFSFYSDSRHNDTIEVCNLNVNGLDRNVCIPITLALPAPPHSPTSAVGRHISFDSTPPPSPRHHRVSSLCEALRSPTVGDECLADTLKDHLRPFRGRNGPSVPDDRNITEAARELERQAEQCASDSVMGTTTKKIVKLMKQVEPLLIDPTLTQQLVDQTKLIDAECQQLVELAKEVQKHTKHDLSTQITRVVSFAHQLSHLASARLKSRTANDIDVDIEFVEAAKNLTSSIGGILSSAGAATLVVTSRRKPRLSMQASRSNLREKKRRQTSVDVKALKQALEAKEEKPRRLRAQTSVDVKALAQVLEAQGYLSPKGEKTKGSTM